MYTLVGGVFAGLVFSTCVVSIPMILDRDTDAITAGIASIQVVAGRTGPMLVWGSLIVALVLGALLLPWALGLLVVGPLAGPCQLARLPRLLCLAHADASSCAGLIGAVQR